MFGEHVFISVLRKIAISYKGTKWASPLQLSFPSILMGDAHFVRRCAAAFAAFLCTSCASRGAFYDIGNEVSYIIKKQTLLLRSVICVLFYVPSKLHTKNHPFPITLLGYALDLLVTVSTMCYHTSTSALSTSSSSRGLTNLTLWDISS